MMNKLQSTNVVVYTKTSPLGRIESIVVVNSIKITEICHIFGGINWLQHHRVNHSWNGVLTCLCCQETSRDHSIEPPDKNKPVKLL